MQYYDEQEYEQAQQVAKANGKKAIYITSYFFLLAVFMYPAQALHMGTAAIFFAMMGAGIVLVLGILLFKVAKRKLQASNMSRRDLVNYAVGFNPDDVPYDEEEEQQDYPHTEPIHEPYSESRALVPAPMQGAIQPYAQEEETYDVDGLPTHIIDARNPMFLSETYQPSINDAKGKQIVIVGKRRSGKSNLFAVHIEEFGRYEPAIPIVTFDTESEYGGVVDRKYLRHPVLAGSLDLLKENPDLKHFVAIDPAGAYEFGKAIMDGRLQVVVDLLSFCDEDAGIVMSEIVEGINDWQQSLPDAKRLPVVVGLDETAKWFPQNPRDSIVPVDVQRNLNEAFFQKMVARGGKRGFIPLLAFQRYSQVHKNLLSADWLYLLKQTEEIDLERYEKKGLHSSEVFSLRQGEAFVFSHLVLGFKVLFRERVSPHLGNTPGLANLLKEPEKPIAQVLNRSFTSKLPDNVVEARPAPETAQLQEAPTRALSEGTYVPAPAPEKIVYLDKRQKLAYTLYLQGKTGIVELAAAMTANGSVGNVPQSAAYRLILELENMGHITNRAKRSGSEIQAGG